ncbi:MAG: hypothetical protein NUV47_02390 [Patescibacteria group bacterium]|nr:hypothetical protein [Patescibacteria group bacterium]
MKLKSIPLDNDYYVYGRINQYGDVGFILVDGAHIIIKKWENYDFFIHSSVDGFKGYTISEGRTGTDICSGRTKKEAINNMVGYLAKISKIWFNRYLGYIIHVSGVSPRYIT